MVNRIDIIGPKHIIIPVIYLALNIILIFCPQILYGLPSHLQTEEPYKAPLPEEEMGSTKSSNTADLLLFTDNYIEEMRQRIDTIVQNEEYCNQDLSRSRLSNLTNIPLHHLSYYFANVLNIKFTDWRNQLRVEHAKRLIASDLMKSLTLDAIANQSGFGNRQNFIAALKKNTDMTPSEYIALIKQS